MCSVTLACFFYTTPSLAAAIRLGTWDRGWDFPWHPGRHPEGGGFYYRLTLPMAGFRFYGRPALFRGPSPWLRVVGYSLDVRYGLLHGLLQRIRCFGSRNGSSPQGRHRSGFFGPGDAQKLVCYGNATPVRRAAGCQSDRSENQYLAPVTSLTSPRVL